MKKIKNILLFLVLILSLVSCDKSTLTKLDTPTLTENNGVINWEKIENASKYILYIDGSDEVDLDLNITSYELPYTEIGIHKVKIKAIGDNEKYSDSDYSNTITYTVNAASKTKLETPVIEPLSSAISWSHVQNAIKYEIYINDEYIESVSTNYYGLSNYQNETILIKIRAVGNTNKYENSDYSNVVEYNFSEYLMTISEVKEEIDKNANANVPVMFIGKVIGFDSMGYAHVADETGSIYVRYICNELKLGNTVLIKGSAIVYKGSGRYTEYTRQITSSGITVTLSDKEVNPIENTVITKEDLESKDVSASFHGNPVTITGTVECGTDRYSFYLNDEYGNHLVAIHHYSTNFNNSISDYNKNIFLNLNNHIVTLKGIIYRYYDSDNIWTLQCVGFDDEVIDKGIRIMTPIVTKNEEKLTWTVETSIDVKYNIYVNNNLYKVTNDTSFDLSTLGDGTFKVQVQAIPTNNEKYQPSIYSKAIVYIKSDLAKNVNIFMINDTHGSFVDTNYPGVERLSTLLKELTNTNGEYIKIMNGDAFQGSYASNVLMGLPLIDAFNEMEFDAFVIGNHEFDWGLEEIHKYKDGDYTNGEADFPFLGANIYDKSTGKRVEWLDPYVVVEQNGIKVGVIGIIGHDLESSILTENVMDYEFVYPLELIKTYTKELREELNCNVVIVANHDYDEELNNEIANLSGEYLVDAILCGHTHQNVYEDLVRSDDLYIVAIENRDKNQSASSLILNLDENLNYESYKYERYYPSNYALDSEMTMIISKYQDVIDEGNRVIGTTSKTINKQTLGMYAVTKMKTEYEVDVAIINTGGVRSTISSGKITVSSVFEVFPFNNKIILTSMKGSALKSLYEKNSSYLYFNSDFDVTTLIANDYYKVAVIDYVYTSTRYTEFNGTTKTDTNCLLRDLLIDYIDELY